MDTPAHASDRHFLPTGPLSAADQVRLGARHLHHDQPRHLGILVGLASFPAICANVIATSIATVPFSSSIGGGSGRKTVSGPSSNKPSRTFSFRSPVW
jgi:hypothetical protein